MSENKMTIKVPGFPIKPLSQLLDSNPIIPPKIEDFGPVKKKLRLTESQINENKL